MFENLIEIVPFDYNKIKIIDTNIIELIINYFINLKDNKKELKENLSKLISYSADC